jgi:hypothetical protein
MRIDRVTRAIGGVLDRTTDKPHPRGDPDGFRDRPRIIAKAVLKIGAYRQVGG